MRNDYKCAMITLFDYTKLITNEAKILDKTDCKYDQETHKIFAAPKLGGSLRICKTIIFFNINCHKYILKFN